MEEIDFLLKSLELKDEKRTGWDVRGVERPETVAGHSWNVAFLSFLLSGDAGVDCDKAVEMGLIHDIHEAVSGDIMSSGLDESGKREKKEKELDGFETLLDLSDRELEELRELWEEYEEQETVTARFVKDMDVLDSVLQAFLYVRDERYGDEEEFFQEWSGVEEFFENTRQELHTETGREVFEAVEERYERVKD